MEKPPTPPEEKSPKTSCALDLRPEYLRKPAQPEPRLQRSTVIYFEDPESKEPSGTIEDALKQLAVFDEHKNGVPAGKEAVDETDIDTLPSATNIEPVRNDIYKVGMHKVDAVYQTMKSETDLKKLRAERESLEWQLGIALNGKENPKINIGELAEINDTIVSITKRLSDLETEICNYETILSVMQEETRTHDDLMLAHQLDLAAPSGGARGNRRSHWEKKPVHGPPPTQKPLPAQGKYESTFWDFNNDAEELEDLKDYNSKDYNLKDHNSKDQPPSAAHLTRVAAKAEKAKLNLVDSDEHEEWPEDADF
jgi:hypothetical protein